MNYPNTPGYQRHSETSRIAAEELTTQAATESDILYLLEANQNGLTADELRDMLEPRHTDIQSGTVAARLRGLDLEGKAKKTTAKRMTRNNRPAHVWKHPRFAIQGEVIPPTEEKGSAGRYRKALERIEDHMRCTGYGREHQPIMDILKSVL